MFGGAAMKQMDQQRHADQFRVAFVPFLLQSFLE